MLTIGQRVTRRFTISPCTQDGVVLGADTRSTNGETVADKNCEKIHYIADNIWCVPRHTRPLLFELPTLYSPPSRLGRAGRSSLASTLKFVLPLVCLHRCCGAGTSADTEATTQLISSQIELHRLATGKAPRTITAMTLLKRKLFQYQVPRA